MRVSGFRVSSRRTLVQAQLRAQLRGLPRACSVRCHGLQHADGGVKGRISNVCHQASMNGQCLATWARWRVQGNGACKSMHAMHAKNVSEGAAPCACTVCVSLAETASLRCMQKNHISWAAWCRSLLHVAASARRFRVCAWAVACRVHVGVRRCVLWRESGGVAYRSVLEREASRLLVYWNATS